ncbi:MAG: ABC transporter ATP-binding protein [Planctomycetes bacterium]|nr:ABC transporter ATP-binding protein [Planctomycetota bacterium]
MNERTEKAVPAIRASNVARRFGRREVLSGVSLEVSAGEILGLLGPSGAGKTTLVRMVAGADRPTSGEVEVDGVRMPSLEVLPRIGYMAQADALYADLTGRENLEFFGALYGLAGAGLASRIEASAALVGMSADLDRPVHTYSGGMKRRVSLAIALVHEPRILVLDEPTVGIDPVLRGSIWDELRRLLAAGVSILVTTHVMDEAEKCDRVFMLRDGKGIALDTPAGLKASAAQETLEGAFLHFARAGRAP